MAAEVAKITAAFPANCLHLFPFPPPAALPPSPPIPLRCQEAAPRQLSSQDYCPHAAAPNQGRIHPAHA